MIFDSACLKMTDPDERAACEKNIPYQHKMHWFRNLKSREPFQPGDVSGDYSLQLQTGYHNFQAWNNPKKGFWYRTKLKVPLLFDEAEKARVTEAKREPLRAVGIPLDKEET